mmetsp:Transcript_9644/g.29390  ORF Transcript_9644/g.29390 Transcript_9644/m.29390 type:complete len:218 (-) Transcript_9644:432-1085(-)
MNFDRPVSMRNGMDEQISEGRRPSRSTDRHAASADLCAFSMDSTECCRAKWGCSWKAQSWHLGFVGATHRCGIHGRPPSQTRAGGTIGCESSGQQSEHSLNQCSMHAAWKACAQGSVRHMSFGRKGSRQMQHGARRLASVHLPWMLRLPWPSTEEHLLIAQCFSGASPAVSLEASTPLVRSLEGSSEAMDQVGAYASMTSMGRVFGFTVASRLRSTS